MKLKFHKCINCGERKLGCQRCDLCDDFVCDDCLITVADDALYHHVCESCNDWLVRTLRDDTDMPARDVTMIDDV